MPQHCCGNGDAIEWHCAEGTCQGRHGSPGAGWQLLLARRQARGWLARRRRSRGSLHRQGYAGRCWIMQYQQRCLHLHRPRPVAVLHPATYAIFTAYQRARASARHGDSDERADRWDVMGPHLREGPCAGGHGAHDNVVAGACQRQGSSSCLHGNARGMCLGGLTCS